MTPESLKYKWKGEDTMKTSVNLTMYENYLIYKEADYRNKEVKK